LPFLAASVSARAINRQLSTLTLVINSLASAQPKATLAASGSSLRDILLNAFTFTQLTPSNSSKNARALAWRSSISSSTKASLALIFPFSSNAEALGSSLGVSTFFVGAFLVSLAGLSAFGVVGVLSLAL